MDHLAQRIIADLRRNGVALDEVGDGWFAADSRAGVPEAFLHLVDDDVERYLRGMSAEDVAGVFGPDVTLADARYRLALIHLEEHLLSHHGGIRYVIVDGEEIRAFDTAPPPSLPAGDYYWTA
ncbi:hypothetical protein [Micromonospora psammae]|uniref:hypothetical protein n=1 Tax=Micromonospora sp. CPCC 205556 TaxID=3122398 RepID=UPI002FEE75A4